MVIIQCLMITTLYLSCLSLSSSNNIFVDTISSLPMINSDQKNNAVSIDQMLNTASYSAVGQSCTLKTDCKEENTECDISAHKCKCRHNFIDVAKSTKKFKDKTLKCVPMAKLDQKCISDDQCVVSNAACDFQDQAIGALKNASSGSCKCNKGYYKEENEEIVYKNGREIVNSPICGQYLSIGNTWIGTFAIICIMLVVLLIGCFVGIIRFQRWKQRPFANTITSLSATTGQTPHLISVSPPPMGSVEAEFQNDFIQVFPMHHLEPLPDKDTTHYIK